MSTVGEDSTPRQPKGPESPEEGSAPTEVPADPVEPAASTDVTVPAPIVVPDTGYTPAGVPTLEGVREKIETRFGTALGATELAEDAPEGRTAAQRFEARQKAAEERLEEIRASMREPGRG